MVAFDDALADLSDSCDVLLLLRLRLQRAVLARHERPFERAVRDADRAADSEHARLVERFAARVVLLPVAVARPWVCGHDDSGLRAVDAGSPRVARPDEAAVAELEGVLSQVPDVPLLVLSVEVQRALDRARVLGDGVSDNRGANAEDLPRLERHHLVVCLWCRAA